MQDPTTSYSCLDMHICGNVDKHAMVEPPIHAEYVLTLWWHNDLQGGVTWCKRILTSFCILSAIPAITWELASFTRQHNVGILILTDVYITLHDVIICGFMDTRCLHTQEAWLQKSLRAGQ